jgi:hypothetical protein
VQRFGVDEGDIRDLTIRDDNTVRFSVQSIDAKEKAQNISSAVSCFSLEAIEPDQVDFRSRTETFSSSIAATRTRHNHIPGSVIRCLAKKLAHPPFYSGVR